MKVIRYNLHFATLTLAVVVFWLAQDVALFDGSFGSAFFPYGLMGALHSTSIVISLRDRKAARPITALCFIALAAVWSVATPIIGLWSSILLVPVSKIVPLGEYRLILIFLDASAIGASGYWLLVRLFWVKSLRCRDWLRTMAVCVAATLLSFVAIEVLKPSDHLVPAIFTIAWWFAFSISLYWSEMRRYANKSAKALQTLP